MKVLQEGPGWSIERKCTGKGNGGGGCESLLKIEIDDIYQTSNTDMTGFTDHYTTFRCIVCGVETDIDVLDVPPRVKRLSKINPKK